MHEQDLIQQAQQGDAQAFAQLLQAHYDTMFRFAWHWCGNRADAEDIVQQACLKLARSIDQFRFESAFQSWLYRLVINCAKDWHKSQSRHQSPESATTTENAADHHQPDNQIFLQQLLRYLDTLADGMKETALLVHALGCSHGETATILGVKESTISWRIHEIRKQLQSRFGQEAL